MSDKFEKDKIKYLLIRNFGQRRIFRKCFHFSNILLDHNQTGTLDKLPDTIAVGIRKPTLQKPETLENQDFLRMVFKWLIMSMMLLAAILYLPFKIHTKKFAFQMVNSRYTPKRPDFKW